MYIPKNFKLYEVFPRAFFEEHFPYYGHRLWAVFPGATLKTLQGLRDLYGRMVMNTWYWGGKSQYRGWRPMDCNVGARLSMHKFAIAFDLLPIDADVNEIRKDILANQWEEPFRHITCVELGTPHLHIDFRNHDKKTYGILEIEP